MSDAYVWTATGSTPHHVARRWAAPLAAVLVLAAALLTGSSHAAVGGKKPPGSRGSGLVAAYSFDEGGGSAIGDASGNGNSGLITGAAWTTGHSRSALSFNGSSNWVTVPDSASLDLTQMTLEAWVRPTAPAASWNTIVTKESSGHLVYGLFGNSNSSQPATLVTVGASAQQTIALGKASLPLSSWSYVAATYDGSTLRFYVNGTAVASSSVSGPIDASTAPLRIGGNNVWSEWFQGKIDDVRIYNRALDASAIQSNMNSPLGGTGGSGGDTQAPSAPSTLAVAGIGQTSMTLSWNASTDNVGVAGYTVYNGSAAVASTADTSYTLSGLTCGTMYVLAVDAYDVAGNRSARTPLSAATSACPDTQPPTAPGELTATAATQNSLNLAWSASSDNVGVTGYTVYNGVVVAGSTSTTSYTVSGLNCGTTYTLAIEAYDAAGNLSATTPANAATTACPVSDTQPPTVPSALAATAATQNSISVVWGGSLDNVGVTGYAVYNGGASAGSTAGLFYTVTGLSCGTSYTLGVDAYDAAGNHSAKATITASTSACPIADTQPPTAPTNVSTRTTANSIGLTWSPSTDNVGVLGYGIFLNGTPVGQTAATAYTVSGLPCGTSYTIGIDSYDAAGNRSIKVSTLVSTAACADTQAPSVPGSPQASLVTGSGMTLSWSPSTDNVGVAGYGVYVKGALAGSTAQTSYAVSGLACGTTYALGVDAYDLAGNRSSQASINVQTSACAPAAGTLTWAPPALVGPTTIQLSSPTVDLNLDPSRDYVLKLPTTRLIPGDGGGLYINGGHNVVVIGGELYFDKTSGATETNGRVAAIFNNTGTVHFEGIWAHGPGLVEGIQNYSSRTIVQVENCRFDHLKGSEATYHSDLFQFGVGNELRIDHFTGSSSYQGLFITNMTGHVYAKNVNIDGDPGADMLAWQGTAYVPWTLQAVYARVSDGTSLGIHVWPSIYGTAPYEAQVDGGGSVWWPSAVDITGSVLAGSPPGGDFVPNGVAGIGYASPGYTP